MNIALLTSTLEGGGAARVMVHMANYWAAAGNEVTLLSFEDGSRPSFYALDGRVRVRYLALNRHSPHLLSSMANNWRRFVSIRSAVRAAKPEALISFIDSANVRTIIALLGTGIPVIVSERVHPRFEKIGWVWALLRRLTYPLACCLVVQTAEIAEHVKNWGVGRVAVIPNPVIPVPVLGDAPDLPRPCLLAVGRLYPQKGYELLLRAFAVVARQHPGWRLCIAGEGPLRPQLESAVAESGLTGRVLLMGQVADVGGLLKQADAYVLSSSYEGFPNSLCEAMAAGLACVSTNCPSGPGEVVDHGENGLLVTVDDAEALAAALSSIMRDAALRERLGTRAKNICQRFSLSQVMAQWQGVVTQCTEIRTGGGR